MRILANSTYFAEHLELDVNMLDIVPASAELSPKQASGPRVLPIRRAPPTAVRLVLPVWGYRYVRQFLEFGLLTLLAPGNVPALAKALPSEFLILTSTEDEDFIRQHAAFKRLSAICRTEIRLIDHLITDGNISTTITLAYSEVVRAAGPAMLDTCFFFLVSDYIMADGSLSNALERMQRGASALVVGNFQVVLEDALPWLEDKLTTAKSSLVIAPRHLMRWALNHLHPATIANMVNIPFSHNSHTNRLFWRVDGSTLLGRFYLMHMLCVRPEVTEFIIGASCDYSFVPEMCPSGNVEPITDSDDYLAIEMQPRDHETAFLRSGPLKPAALAKTLAEWTTEIHRNNARCSLIFHSADRSPKVNEIVAAADVFVAEVSSKIKRAPLPTRGHPYWRGAMAAFNDATGRKLSSDEWRLALGLPVASGWFTDWLVWRAQYALLGRPPHVFPWHPFWPDFRPVLKELEPYLSDPAQRLLMVSNAPTIFTVSFADSGERAYRLRLGPLLQSPPERYEPMEGRFNLCLVELSEGEMAQGDELIDRIVPLMKFGGRILVVINNRRLIGEAKGFANGVSFHGARFIRSGASLSELRFLPASRLRWMVHRGMARLRDLVNRSPVIGVPTMIFGGGFLAILSLLGNFDALRRTRSKPPRGIASSVLMTLRVDTRQANDAHIYSRYQIDRKRRRKRLGLNKQPSQPADSDLVPSYIRPGEATGVLPAVENSTHEPQYARCLELKNTIGLTSLGLLTNQVWEEDPGRLGILLARYKFVAKMLNGRRNVGEVGCGDAFGSRVVLQEVERVSVYDFDPVLIEDVRSRHDERWPLEAYVHDIVLSPLPQRHDGLLSLGVLEHIPVQHEHAYLANLRGSLTGDGVLIIGTPSIELAANAAQPTEASYVNCKSGQQLKVLLGCYFDRVFMFSMNDEVVHTGLHPMAHYLFAVCTGAK